MTLKNFYLLASLQLTDSRAASPACEILTRQNISRPRPDWRTTTLNVTLRISRHNGQCSSYLCVINQQKKWNVALSKDSPCCPWRNTESNWKMKWQLQSTEHGENTKRSRMQQGNETYRPKFLFSLREEDSFFKICSIWLLPSLLRKP